jgi:hypothetical protein
MRSRFRLLGRPCPRLALPFLRLFSPFLLLPALPPFNSRRLLPLFTDRYLRCRLPSMLKAASLQFLPLPLLNRSSLLFRTSFLSRPA